MSRLRYLYWARLRRYHYEICHGTHRVRGCGRPVGLVWTAPNDLWDTVMTGAPLPGTEGAPGVLCLPCFDRAMREQGHPSVRWVPVEL